MVKDSSRLYTFKFWLLCVSSFFFFASFNLILPELPDYLESIGGGAHKGLIVPLFTLMAGFSRPFSGRLTDTVGRVPIMIYGVFICIIAGFLYPILTTVAGFFLLRVMHGMSTGFKPTATSAYVGDISPILRRGEAMGIFGTFGSFGMAAGPAFSSLITRNFGYNTLFYCSSILALISILVVIWVPETLTKRKPFKFKLLKLRRVDVFEPKAVPPSIVMLLSTVAFGAILTIIPDFSKHLGQEDKGVFFTIFTMSSILSRLIAGKWSDKFGRERILLYGLIIYGVAMVFIGWSDSLLEFYIWAFVLGIAVGNNMPTIYAWTIDMADDKYRGRALATMFIALEIGIGLGGVISGYSYNNNPDNFPVSFFMTAVFLFMSVVYLLWYMNQKKSA